VPPQSRNARWCSESMAHSVIEATAFYRVPAMTRSVDGSFPQLRGANAVSRKSLRNRVVARLPVSLSNRRTFTVSSLSTSMTLTALPSVLATYTFRMAPHRRFHWVLILWGRRLITDIVRRSTMPIFSSPSWRCKPCAARDVLKPGDTWQPGIALTNLWFAYR